jgi:ceramide glucosyltransferase
MTNRKVERLVAAAAVARGEILFISDSNARVASRDVARTVAAFDDPSVGCVSNVFVARGAETLGARIEALHLLTFVVPGNVLAFSGEVPCVVGKSMAMPRAVVERIGGFEAFLRVLAEDQAIGLAVHRAGWRVVLSPVVVSNVVIRRSVRRALERQARWNKIRYAFSKATYGGELLLNPFGVACLAALVAALLVPLALGPCLSLVAVSALARMLQASFLARATGAPCDALDLALMPAKDLLQLWSQLAPYVSSGVTWHGFRAQLGPGTALLPPRELAGEVGALALS